MNRFAFASATRHARAKPIAFAGAAAVALMLALPIAAGAEPIELKLAFHGSEHTNTYRYGIKPFVDAINTDGKGILAIKIYANGALGKGLAQQPGLVLDETADIAFVVPGQTSYRFPDSEAVELPGLFRDIREGTLVYTRLIAANALRGYQDFFVIGAYTSAPSVIHSRQPIKSLADLKGQKIRANNPVEAEALNRLGAIPTVLPAAKVAASIRSGTIDGGVLSPTGLFDFGVSKVATNHYLLLGGVAPLALVMSRRTFDHLPAAAKALIRKHSGEWTAATWIQFFGATEIRSRDQLKSDPARKTVEPSPADRQTAQRIYRSMIESWAPKSPHNRELLKTIEADIAAIRANAE